MNKIIRKQSAGQHMQANERAGVLYFTFPALSEIPFVLHGFSSRIGGVSEGILSSMNLSFTRGDDPDHVRENFRRIAAAIGFSPEDMVFSYQTHTTNVRRMTEEDRGKGFAKERDYEDVDGMITDVPGLVLTGFFADCVPLYFVDPVHRAVGLSHSGWRGTVHDIAGNTVSAMQESFGTDPSDLICAIGPSICQDCYEVSEDVIAIVRENYPEELWPQLFYKKNKETAGRSSKDTADSSSKYQLNLWEACFQNLLRAGVLPDHITVTDLCTCCNPDLFFSHRASHGKRGNLAAFLGLRCL